MALRSRLGLAIAVSVYAAILSWAYVNLITPSFAYLGYVYQPPNASSLVLAWITAVIPVAWLPLQLKRPSQLVYWVLYVMVYLPSLVIPVLAIDGSLSSTLFHGALLLAGFAALGVVIALPKLSLSRPTLPPSLFWLTIVFASVCTDIYIISRFGLSLHVLSLNDVVDVYGLRSDYKFALSQTDPLISYAVGWQTNVLNPLLIVRGLVARKPMLLTLGVLGQIGVFEISGLKAVLFSSALILILIGVIVVRRRQFGITLVWGASMLIVVSILADSTLGSVTFTSLFVRRLLATPGLLTGAYFQFFSEYPKMLLSHSILKGVVHNPYGSLSPPFLIGASYFHNSATDANANVWADAFANFGAIGVLAFSVLLGGILWLFDSLTRNANLLIASLMLGMPAITLSNSALLTTLLTHGMLLAIVLSVVMPKTHPRAIEVHRSEFLEPPNHPQKPRTQNGGGMTQAPHLLHLERTRGLEISIKEVP